MRQNQLEEDPYRFSCRPCPGELMDQSRCSTRCMRRHHVDSQSTTAHKCSFRSSAHLALNSGFGETDRNDLMRTADEAPCSHHDSAGEASPGTAEPAPQLDSPQHPYLQVSEGKNSVDKSGTGSALHAPIILALLLPPRHLGPGCAASEAGYWHQVRRFFDTLSTPNSIGGENAGDSSLSVRTDFQPVAGCRSDSNFGLEGHDIRLFRVSFEKWVFKAQRFCFCVGMCLRTRLVCVVHGSVVFKMG